MASNSSDQYKFQPDGAGGVGATVVVVVGAGAGAGGTVVDGVGIEGTVVGGTVDGGTVDGVGATVVGAVVGVGRNATGGCVLAVAGGVSAATGGGDGFDAQPASSTAARPKDNEMYRGRRAIFFTNI